MTFEKCLKQLLIKYPFYGLLLTNYNKIIHRGEDAKCQTLSVGYHGIDLIINVNLDFWELQNDKQQTFLLLHELNHIAFFHCTEKYLQYDHHLMNCCMDAVINTMLLKDPALELPVTKKADGSLEKMGITLESLEDACKERTGKEIKLPEGKGCLYYYQEIRKFISQNGGSTDFSEGSPDNHEGWPNQTPQGKALSSAIDQMTKEKCIETVRRTVDACKSKGSIPAGVEELLDLLTTKSVFNWKKMFRRCIGSSSDFNVRKTHQKENKRFSQMPKLKYQFKSNILVAVDTSGSLSKKELQEVFQEVYHVWKAGVSVDVVQFDAELYPVEKYKGVCPTIKGGGGTNFDLALEFYKNNRKYDHCIIFTDGYDTPTIRVNKKLTWVITSEGSTDTLKEFPGTKIQIPK